MLHWDAHARGRYGDSDRSRTNQNARSIRLPYTVIKSDTSHFQEKQSGAAYSSFSPVLLPTQKLSDAGFIPYPFAWIAHQ